MSEISINQLLGQMRAMAQQAEGLQLHEPGSATSATGLDFSRLLADSVRKVNETQQQAGELAKRFELGDESVSLAEVMVNIQKANLSFQAMTQVRNRLVSAYQDVMNMQI